MRQSLLEVVQETSSCILKYLDSYELVQRLASIEREKYSQIDFIVAGILGNMTAEQVALCRQVNIVLAELANGLPAEICRTWAERIEFAKQNPKSIGYINDMSEKEIIHERNKMDGVLTEEHSAYIALKENKVVKKRNLKVIEEGDIGQIQNLIGSMSLDNSNQQQVQGEKVADSNKGKEKELREQALPATKKVRKVLLEEVPNEQIMSETIRSASVEIAKQSASKTDKEDDKIKEVTTPTQATLEQSIWAPSKKDSREKKCNRNDRYIANIPIYIIPGSTAKDRTELVEWVLRDSTHVMEINEVFKRGNAWVEIVFDCKEGREEAIERTERKEEWLKLIPEVKEESKHSGRKFGKNSAEIYKGEAEGKTGSTSTHKEDKILAEEIMTEEETKMLNEDVFTLWDLPNDISERQIAEVLKYFGEVEEVQIFHRGWRDAKAICKVRPAKGKRKITEEDLWILPIRGKIAARITPGRNREDILADRKKFAGRIVGLPRHANEILLWRQLRNTNAKAVWIPKNTNGKSCSHATVYFKNKDDLARAQTIRMKYFEYNLDWLGNKARKNRQSDAKYSHYKNYNMTIQERNKDNHTPRWFQERGPNINKGKHKPQENWNGRKERSVASNIESSTNNMEYLLEELDTLRGKIETAKKTYHIANMSREGLRRDRKHRRNTVLWPAQRS